MLVLIVYAHRIPIVYITIVTLHYDRVQWRESYTYTVLYNSTLKSRLSNEEIKMNFFINVHTYIVCVSICEVGTE